MQKWRSREEINLEENCTNVWPHWSSWFFEFRHLEKDGWSSPVFLGYDFSCKWDGQPYFKLDLKKGVISIYWTISRMLGFLGSAVVWDALQYVVDLGLWVVFTDAYNTAVARSWCHSIAVDCILFHMKFEGGWSISILRNRGTLFKKIGIVTNFQNLPLAQCIGTLASIWKKDYPHSSTLGGICSNCNSVPRWCNLSGSAFCELDYQCKYIIIEHFKG